MPDLSLLLASLTDAKLQKLPTPQPAISQPTARFVPACGLLPQGIAPTPSHCPEFTRSAALPDLLPRGINPYLPEVPASLNRPRSGSQLFLQRLEALRQGKTYTRLSPNSFSEVWANSATPSPTYEQWVSLLRQEASVMARGQGGNRLTVMLGDSLSQWFPTEQLSSSRFWLNQGISGDTTAGILQRLSAFEQTQPDSIYVMAGVNDVKTGVTDEAILANLQQIIQRLHQAHPQAQIVIYGILPTRWAAIPSDRIAHLNQQIARLTQQENASYFDMTTAFADGDGTLRPDLTTDGLHLNPQGYAVWSGALRAMVAQPTHLAYRAPS